LFAATGSGVAQSEEEALRAQIAKLEQDARDALEERSSLVWQVRHICQLSGLVDCVTQKQKHIFRRIQLSGSGLSLDSHRAERLCDGCA
jgi:hypothetical protein